MRLPPQPGEWIDRDSPIQFRFEGREFGGFLGDVATSALWAAGVTVLGRSFKYHRPRGTCSFSAHDTGALLEEGLHTNLRGDALPLRQGLDLRGVNTWGGLNRDLLRFTQWAARLMPVGFYYKAFHTPRRMFPIYEKLLRKAAGLGRVRLDARSAPTPKDYAFCDLLVVGAGPSGLSAALAAGKQGARVLVVDDLPRPGGSGLWQTAPGTTERQRLKQLLDELAACENVEWRCGTQVAGAYADRWFALVNECRLTKLRASAVVVATGAFEQPAVFQNNDLPGVLLGSAAQRLARLYAVRPCQRCVILAGNSDAYRLALDMKDIGVEIAAIADLRPEGETSAWGPLVEQAGIETFHQHAIYEAQPGRRGAAVVGAMICRLDSTGELVPGEARRVPCDGILVSVGWAPAAAPLYQAGARLTYAPVVEQFVPAQLPAGYFAAGRVRGVFAWEDRLADGNRAGLAAASYLDRYRGPLPLAIEPIGPSPSHPYPIFPHPGKKNFVDLDEDLHLVDFVNAHQEGYDNIELLKRYTTFGMGPSQGKLANMNAVRILARLNGRSINETGSTTSRPFHRPTPLSHLAGRRFHPVRRTALHSWHVASGAEMVHVGDWLRPEYYRSGDLARNQTILREAQHVRDQVGLIDLGTLGKIQVAGLDAAEFLERIFTGRFHKQPVGKLRYCVACDESGVIIDDGIAARFDVDRFYVTATTGGAAALFREMQRWALIWRMDVVLVNLTGHLAALNLAGPASRELLTPLTDVDLAADAFGFSGAREGFVAGAPATLLRAGFVGELGYEIHIPSTHAHHVWQTLIDQGSAIGIRPFGIEAQRLLRLEKGHLIVNHDTDALTTPMEAQLEWALAREKPFFVGQRSLAIVAGRPLSRILVGFSLAAHATGDLPEECHLIVRGDEIVGRVTSIAHRSTLGRPIGLAFVRPEFGQPGARIAIRVSDGRKVEAEVAALPFYDPQNERQQ